ncbi:hypothetical protein LRH25_08830 [Ideonella azotifigens]|uniref:AbrB family transcriptional regulator n=1 Tax=Ideonella azotifigens TaxID=513160 RepID=A0ABN1KG20_9BURK|nr:hypothetical protein [Ideonella azotifigens]MCD2340446.1 hypothetical protein [Ideonella azotifigens]
MSKLHGKVVGDVSYREGDGMDMKIPQGNCEIEETKLDVTLGWQDGDARGSAAIPLPDFQRYVDSGALVVEAYTAEEEAAHA